MSGKTSGSGRREGALGLGAQQEVGAARREGAGSARMDVGGKGSGEVISIGGGPWNSKACGYKLPSISGSNWIAAEECRRAPLPRQRQAN
jgi:hypothetical protein